MSQFPYLRHKNNVCTPKGGWNEYTLETLNAQHCYQPNYHVYSVMACRSKRVEDSLIGMGWNGVWEIQPQFLACTQVTGETLAKVWASSLPL